MAKSKSKKRGPVVVAAPQKDDKGLIGTMATTAAIAGTATVAVAGTSAAMGAVFGPDDPQPAAEPVAETVAVPVAPEQVGLTDEQMQQLQKLAALKEQGVLTEEEFNMQKAQILAAT